MKKKTASVLLAFAVIISLCACNSSQRSKDSSDSSTQSETEQVITEAEESTGEDTERLSEDAAPASENNALTSIQEQLEASGVPVTIMDEALLYSLSDWKTETGIDNDRFTEFATEMFTDFDAFQAAYLQPAFDEIVGR